MMLYDSRKDTTIAAILIRARALIVDEKNFQQSGMGSDGRFCAVHAILEAGAVPDNVPFSKVPAVRFLSELCGQELSYYNDRHTHAEVLALFDRGIVEVGRREMY